MKLYFKTVTNFVLIAALIFCFVPFSNTSTQQESRYSAYGSLLSMRASTSETITFTRKEYTTAETVKGVPKYNQTSDLANSCGAVAGAMIVGFYDKYYENLIPDYQTYVASGTYKGRDSVYIPKLIGELYTLMRTNVDDVGVSERDCINGLKAYVNGKNHSLSYASIKDANRVNENLYTNAINNNHPVLLFCSKMDIYTFSSGSNQDIVACTRFDGAHVAVAFGLYIVNYYNGNSVYRTDKYLRIATGLSLMPTGYLKISSTDWCNNAYEMQIN